MHRAQTPPIAMALFRIGCVSAADLRGPHTTLTTTRPLEAILLAPARTVRSFCALLLTLQFCFLAFAASAPRVSAIQRLLRGSDGAPPSSTISVGPAFHGGNSSPNGQKSASHEDNSQNAVALVSVAYSKHMKHIVLLLWPWKALYCRGALRCPIHASSHDHLPTCCIPTIFRR